MSAMYVQVCGMFIVALGGIGPSASVLLSQDGIAYEKIFTESDTGHGLLGSFFDGENALVFGGDTSLQYSECFTFD